MAADRHPDDLPDPDDVEMVDNTSVKVVEIIEQPNMVEFYVPLELCERPELQMFLEVGAYLRDLPDRVSLISFNVAYVQSVVPVLIGVLVYGPPIQEDERAG